MLKYHLVSTAPYTAWCAARAEPTAAPLLLHAQRGTPTRPPEPTRRGVVMRPTTTYSVVRGAANRDMYPTRRGLWREPEQGNLRVGGAMTYLDDCGVTSAARPGAAWSYCDAAPYNQVYQASAAHSNQVSPEAAIQSTRTSSQIQGVCCFTSTRAACITDVQSINFPHPRKIKPPTNCMHRHHDCLSTHTHTDQSQSIMTPTPHRHVVTRFIAIAASRSPPERTSALTQYLLRASRCVPQITHVHPINFPCSVTCFARTIENRLHTAQQRHFASRRRLNSTACVFAVAK